MENTNSPIGFIKVTNLFAEAMARTKLSENESRIVWTIVRKTWGWNKNEDMISLGQFKDLTGINDRSNIFRTINGLVIKKVVLKSKVGRKCAYSINLNSKEWFGIVPQDNINVVAKDNNLLSEETANLLSGATNTKDSLRNTTKQNTVNSGSAAGVPPTTSPRQPTPVQLLVTSYKKFYLQKFGIEPSISNNSWGKYGRLLKNKLEEGYTLEQITDLLKVFATSKDSRPENLGFNLGTFFSDSVFNKMEMLKVQNSSTNKLEEKYGKWK